MTTHPFTFSQPSPCRVCRGAGRITVGSGRGEQLPCPACQPLETAPGEHQSICPECDGERELVFIQSSGGHPGQIEPREWLERCPECNGSGRVWIEDEEDAA